MSGVLNFDPDFAEEPGFIEPYLSALRDGPRINESVFRSGHDQSERLRQGSGRSVKPVKAL